VGTQLLQEVGHCTLAISDTEDGGKKGVMHVLALTPRPHFLGSLRFGTRRQTHVQIEQALKPYHERLRALNVKVKGLVTDNDHRMRMTRRVHHEKHGGCRPGCGPHAGHLVSGDIFRFPRIKETLTKAKSIASAIKVRQG